MSERRRAASVPALSAVLALLAAAFTLLAAALPAAAATPRGRRIEVPAPGSYALRDLPQALAAPGAPPAPATVFLHGSGSSPEQWQPLLAGLAEDLGMVLVVPRADSALGFGPGRDAVTVAEALRLVGGEIPLAADRTSIAGHSSGGAFAAVLAYAGDLRFAGVFALGIPYRTVLEVADPAYTPPIRLYYGTADPNYTGGSFAAWVEQLDRLGAAVETEIAPGFDHGSWPATTLADGFSFLLAQRYRTAAGCEPTATRLCLAGGRFAVEAHWRTPQGTAGPARVAEARGPDSGLFWFFRPDNWELQVKVLDGCSLTGRYWVFAAAATNVEYDLTVTDVTSGEHADYHHDAGPPAPASTDTLALHVSP
jgi:predicted esterase